MITRERLLNLHTDPHIVCAGVFLFTQTAFGLFATPDARKLGILPIGLGVIGFTLILGKIASATAEFFYPNIEPHQHLELAAYTFPMGQLLKIIVNSSTQNSQRYIKLALNMTATPIFRILTLTHLLLAGSWLLTSTNPSSE